MKYTVNVGNIGNIDCENYGKALEIFKEYISQSKSGIGRAGFESVTLLCGESVMQEYIPTLYDVEHTDTFEGEANYSWVTRKVISVPPNASQRAIVREAKKSLGLKGLRTYTENYGDGFTLRLQGICQIVFIKYRETI